MSISAEEIIKLQLDRIAEITKANVRNSDESWDLNQQLKETTKKLSEQIEVTESIRASRDQMQSRQVKAFDFMDQWEFSSKEEGNDYSDHVIETIRKILHGIPLK